MRSAATRVAMNECIGGSFSGGRPGAPPGGVSAVRPWDEVRAAPSLWFHPHHVMPVTISTRLVPNDRGPAVVVLVGALGVRAWRDEGTAAPTTTSRITLPPGLITDTPVTASPSADPAVGPPGYVATSLPDGFVAAGAFSAAGSSTSLSPPIGVFELWSEPGATRTQGRWFAAVVTDRLRRQRAAAGRHRPAR